MEKVFRDLPDWIFEMEEVSAGVYEVVGKDSTGRVVSTKGMELDLLIERCRTEARKASARRKRGHLDLSARADKSR
jgi:hypothetical protein